MNHQAQKRQDKYIWLTLFDNWSFDYISRIVRLYWGAPASNIIKDCFSTFLIFSLLCYGFKWPKFMSVVIFFELLTTCIVMLVPFWTCNFQELGVVKKIQTNNKLICLFISATYTIIEKRSSINKITTRFSCASSTITGNEYDKSSAMKSSIEVGLELGFALSE